MTVIIRNPCTESWDDMAPRGEGRFCERCERTVVDLSQLTRRQAEARVARAKGGRLCRVLRLDIETGEPVFRPERSRAPRWAGGLVLATSLLGGCEVATTETAAEVLARWVPMMQSPAPKGRTTSVRALPPVQLEEAIEIEHVPIPFILEPEPGPPPPVGYAGTIVSDPGW